MFNGRSWSIFQTPTVGAYYTFGTGFQLDGASQKQRVAPEQVENGNVVSPNGNRQPPDARCFTQYKEVELTAVISGGSVGDKVGALLLSAVVVLEIVSKCCVHCNLVEKWLVIKLRCCDQSEL
jgi:hypothetical protein